MKKFIAALVWFAAGVALGMVLQYTISERRLPATASLDTLPRLGDLAAIGTAGGFVGIVIALFLQRKANDSARQVATRDATEVVFRKWWGLDSSHAETDEDREGGIHRDMPALRRYFYNEFLDWCSGHGTELATIRLKDFSEIEVENSNKDRGRLANLTFFFDEVGWLGAAGLIDVNHVLGPMQHVLRRVWWVSKSLIENDREKESKYWLDPVRHFGIEWLYQRSVVTPQIDLIQHRFPDLPALSQSVAFAKSPNEELRRQLAEDEAEFLSRLPEVLRSKILAYDKAVLAKLKHRWGRGQKHARLLQACFEARMKAQQSAASDGGTKL